MSKYEREGNAPENWRTDVILQRSKPKRKRRRKKQKQH